MIDRKYLIIAMFLALGLATFTAMPQAWADDNGEEVDEEIEGEGEESAVPTTLRRGGRMEFDARLIRGETAGAGAVFLFQRTPRALPSMINRRSSYLGNTVHSVLGPEWEVKFDESKEKAND
ncbi:MAG: hypothetical protein ACNA8W_10970 [Bradymonadaceae bacterium]